MTTDIYLDGEERKDFKEEKIKEVFESLKKELGEKKRVITKLILDNNREVTNWAEIEKLDAEDEQKVDFISEGYNELCMKTISEMKDYLEKLEKGYDSIVELVEKDNINDAMTVLNAATQGIEWMNTAFSKIVAVLEIKLTEEEQKFMADYLNHLSELVKGLEKKDYVEVKDIIIYDLKEDITGWKNLLEKYGEN
ncbi:MAG: hypothetical protein ACQESP_01765 [Candidatus Muiribacteriota bacterium]